MRAVNAAPKMAPHDTMVNGLDAVSITAVRRARLGETISSRVSSPLRIRNAARRVRA